MMNKIVAIMLTVCVGLLGGYALTTGRMKTLFLLGGTLSLPLLFNMSARMQITLFIAAVVLVPIQGIQAIPYSFSISELIFLLLSILIFMKKLDNNNRSTYPTINILEYVPFLLFCFFGFILAMRNGEINVWHTVALVPLMIFFISDKIICTAADARRLINAAFMGVIVAIFIYYIALRTGHATYTYGGESSATWRLGGHIIALGPVSYYYGSITFGTMIALAMPLLTAKAIILRKMTTAFFASIGTIALFMIILVMSSARGAIIATFLSIAVIFIMNARKRFFPSVIFLIVLYILISLIVTYGSSNIIGVREGYFRFVDTRFTGSAMEGNLRSRIDTFNLTIKGMKENPLGNGYGYLWNVYGIDESIAYSAILNGSGVAGFLSFIFIIVFMIRKFLSSFHLGSNTDQTYFSMIGFSTIICGLVTGISCESFVIAPIQSMVFWTIIIASYRGVRCASTDLLDT